MGHRPVLRGRPPRLRLWRGQVVAAVAHARRMRLTAVACVAGYLLFPYRVDAGAGEMRIDLAHQQDHFACDVLARVDIHFLGPATAVAVVAVHIERVAEFTHQRIRAVYPRIHGQQL